MPLSDAVAREMAAHHVEAWADEARSDMLGVIESNDLSQEDAALVMAWVDKASVLVLFPGDEVESVT